MAALFMILYSFSIILVKNIDNSAFAIHLCCVHQTNQINIKDQKTRLVLD